MKHERRARRPVYQQPDDGDLDRVKRGPYQYISHPNYLVVVLEIAIIPLMLGLPYVALLFSILNALLLRHRIRVENKVLDERG